MAATAKTTAKKAEAENVETTFEYDGVTYTVPAPRDVDMDVLEAETEVEMIRLILGEKQWQNFRSVKRTVGDFREFADMVAESRGMDDAGN